jgi:hypothetical protein
MSQFHRTIADNVTAIKKWHDRQHLGTWCECVYEPCNVTDTDFRRVWSA